MSDFRLSDDARAGSFPPALGFDPDAGETPPGLQPPDAPGTVVLLLAGAADREWAARAALELSAAWARGGRRIVLADLELDEPRLHELTGVSNLEGVVDVFLYGASLARSAHPVRGRGFYLIPSGTYAAEPADIFRHPRWAKLVAGFRDASATLLLFLPADSEGVEELARWAAEVVLLGRPEGPAAARLHHLGRPIRALLVPPERVDEPAAPAPLSASALPVVRPEEGDPEEVEPWVPAPSAADDRPEADLHLPPPPEREPPRRGRGVLLLLALLLTVLVFAVAGYLMAGARADRLARNAEPPVSPAPGEAEAPPPVREGRPLPYSVRAKAYASLPEAERKLKENRERFSEAPLFITPEDRTGILYYVIMAGITADTATARGWRERLVAIGAVDEEDVATSVSLIQATPLAFDLGEFPTDSGATAAADSLQARQLFAYPVVVPYSDGSRRWQLYGGAFRDSASAEPMRRALLRAGLTPRLVPRVGAPTQGEAGGG